MNISIPFDTVQAENTGNKRQSDVSEPVCFRGQCFGRTVLLLTRDVVYYSVGLSVGLSVDIPLALWVAGATSGNASAAFAAFTFTDGLESALAGGLAGGIAGGIAGCLAVGLYDRYRHITSTDFPGESKLTKADGNSNPETID